MMRLVRAIALTGLLVVATACGGDDDSSSATSDETTTSITADPRATTTTTTSLTSTTVAVNPVATTCPDIGFEANTDNVATNIKVKGVSCETADPVVRAVKGQAGKNYSINSFDCVTTELDQSQDLPFYPYVCTGVAGFDNQHITFDK